MASKALIFSGRATKYLADKIATSYGIPLGNVVVTDFSDGEFQPSFEENIRGRDVFIVQSTFPPADNLLELLMLVDAARRASAKTIVAVIPYFGLARQDRKDKPRVSVASKLVANLLTAAGVQRIVTLAYLVVWAWNEHKIEAGIARRDPEQHLVILIDEIEAHLHPQWQRRILPALLAVGQSLGTDLQIQFLIATHSPLVTASIEPVFDSEIDKLFHLDIEPKNLIESEAILKELSFMRYGPIDSWLMSDVFELKHARSLEAELAIEDAKSLQLQERPPRQEIQVVSDRLAQYLSAHDEFWPRWNYFAEEHGVHL